MTTIGRILQLPPLPDIPEPFRGRKFVIVEAIYLGDEADGARLLAPLTALGPQVNTLATIPAAELQWLHMDPPEPVPGASDYVMLDDLTPEAVDQIVELAGPGSDSPLLVVEVRQLGGAIAKPRPEHGARGTFPGSYILFAVGMVMAPEMKAVIEGHAGRIVEALSENHSESGYMNFAERAGDASRLFEEESYGRLRAIKAGYDPEDLFRSNHPIPPAR